MRFDGRSSATQIPFLKEFDHRRDVAGVRTQIGNDEHADVGNEPGEPIIESGDQSGDSDLAMLQDKNLNSGPRVRDQMSANLVGNLELVRIQFELDDTYSVRSTGQLTSPNVPVILHPVDRMDFRDLKLGLLHSP
jgi:hypothetical protein